MARYNAWQKAGWQMHEAMTALDHDALSRPRGAFFGSILGTANHLLWGDAMWMSRLAGHARPELPLSRSAEAHPTLAAWWAERVRIGPAHPALGRGTAPPRPDGARCTGIRGPRGPMSRRTVGRLVVHMLNHQAHHRGQIHAMLTAAGQAAPVSDLFLMPDLGAR